MPRYYMALGFVNLLLFDSGCFEAGQNAKTQRPILSIQRQCCNNEVNVQKALINHESA